MSALRSTGSQTVNQLHTPLVRALFPQRNGYRDASTGNECGMCSVYTRRSGSRTNASPSTGLSPCALACFFIPACGFMLPRRNRIACGSCHFSRRELGLRARCRFFALFVLLFSFAAQNERHRYCLFRSRLTTRRFWYCSARRV